MIEIKFRAFLKELNIIEKVTKIDYNSQSIECNNF
jgi:hypothetical protein